MNQKRFKTSDIRGSSVNARSRRQGDFSPIRRSALMRRAFSFAEVMFAVVILGIGFIMVAAIFPVAIQQSAVTGDESMAASIAREAANSIASLPQTTKNQDPLPPTPTSITDFTLFPPTVKNYSTGATPPPGTVPPPAVVVPFTGPRWDAIKNNLILPSDSRYAYVPFYRRENGTTAAQLIVIAVQVRNRSTYDPSLDVANPQPQVVNNATTTRGDFTPGASGTRISPDKISLPGAISAAEGQYAVVLPLGSPADKPVGRSYRLGRKIAGGDFELEAADGMTNAANPPPWGQSANSADNPLASDKVVLFPPATLQPVVAYATLSFAANTVAGRIQLYTDPSTTTAVPDAATTGAFIVLADDYPFDPSNPAALDYDVFPDTAPPFPPGLKYPFQLGALNGRIFRLGQPVASVAGAYDLDPSYGMRGGPGVDASPDTLPNDQLVKAHPTAAGLRAKVFIIGRGRSDPANALGVVPYSGGAQDIAVYTTYFTAGESH